MKSKKLVVGLASLGIFFAQATLAGVGAGFRVSTLGYGVDLGFGVTKSLELRVGYSGLNSSLSTIDSTIDDTDVTYDVESLKISSPYAILDWHAFNGGFHFSGGLVNTGPKLNIHALPTGGSYRINGHNYTSAQIGSIDGTVKVGDSVVPYVGLGWGSTANMKHPVSFLADVGMIRTGTPKAELNVRCGAVSISTCNQINNDLQVEMRDLEDEANGYDWYPLVSVGISVRFK